ncbi:MAG TPA: type II toxin-antitoxin system PemK/MazF family toxin [Turneriella sp.]|nr:type II toxin-antitoxin system PemK/MazF family toxin [Turneriella sp.]HNE20849.1 type II toxin-antitoxin system PemK/MazF family toxin [Turneriella sp.]HNJ65391.1 type II toxin-antitoxin system PemK/MazF family toxin [Turneriella sp.]HNL10953.1 type II toxin-antitoxin system PemK/MazF family toxin [Turneriella sp.]HNL55258.1 type II toxin-antitoxin system PemK/MazF family toxin [Turneriella sp.]
MVVEQYDVFLINLDPTIGHEIKKTRPCLVISPNEMNGNISTIIIAPMTTVSRNYPTRVKTVFKKKTGFIVLDQIRTVDKARLVKKLGRVNIDAITSVKAILREMLID